MFRLGICAVNVNEKKEVTWKQIVEDEKNVRKYFKMIKISNVQLHQFEVKC